MVTDQPGNIRMAEALSVAEQNTVLPWYLVMDEDTSTISAVLLLDHDDDDAGSG